MKVYHDALQYILDHGVNQTDRTGVGTLSVFGMQQRYNLQEGFPAVTTKKLAWRAVVSELLWFIEGSGDERRLAEILHGSRDPALRTIWTDNAQADFWQPKAKFAGDLGRVYGVQWRNWRRPYWDTSIDQLENLIEGIRRDPYSRRHILTAWNPGELDKMALPPCHVFSQFYVANSKLSCQMYQRSCDMFLGVPFNIASYSLLTHMIARVCGLGVGEFVHTMGDAHIYLNHLDQVREQLQREHYALPELVLNSEVTEIDQFTMSDIKLINYKYHPAIRAEMAV